MGLKYDGSQGDDKTNVLEGFADSSISLPVSGMQIRNPKQCSDFFYLQTTHQDKRLDGNCGADAAVPMCVRCEGVQNLNARIWTNAGWAYRNLAG